MADHINEPPDQNIPQPDPADVPQPDQDEVGLPPREDQPPIREDGNFNTAA